jgi:hypothetical protein
MARVVKKSKKAKHFVRTKHAACGATVEFLKEDVKSDRDGAYVVCPFCKAFIAESVLKWRWE